MCPFSYLQSTQYDARGLVVSSTNADGSKVTYQYDALGREKAFADELGRRSETEYDAAGRVVKTIGAARVLNAEAVMIYDPASRVIEERDALGRATRYEYDGVGRLTATVGPNGQRSTTEYDAAGRVTAMVDALGHRTEYKLNASGNVVEEVDALGNVTQYRYDALDRQVLTLDANGLQRSKVYYDAIGQVTSVRDARAYLTQMRYDAVGQRTAVIDALGQTTTYAYNARGELVQETDALGRTTTHSYDAAGQRISQTDAKGQITHWTYDVRGRLTGESHSDGTSIANLYNAAGELTRMTDETGVTLYRYDGLGRQTYVRYSTGHELNYTLDVAGQRTGLRDLNAALSNSASETLYQYDASGRLTQLTNPKGEVTSFSYDALDRVTQKTLANGVVETHVFDEAGRETRVRQRTASGTLFSSFISVYDNLNQRTQVSERDGSVTTYSYDADGQLLSETRTGTHPYAIAYAYNAVGNRTSHVENGLTTTYTYDACNALVSQRTRNSSKVTVSQGTTQCDANGNVTAQTQDGQTTTYLWNTQNYLTKVTAPDGSSESYTYCGEGIRRTVVNASGTRTFIRDGKNILLETDASRAPIRRYTHRGEMWGELISLSQGGASRYYGFDGSANTRLLTDESAGVSDRYLYSAFGEELEVTGSSANPLRFGGEVGYYRDDAERVYVRARHLDVSAGRWVSRDPIGFGGGDWNLYRYVENNPTNQIDPSGLQATPIPQPCPVPPSITPCDAAKQRKKQACSGPPRTCNPNSSKKSSREYKRILNTKNEKIICPAIRIRIANGIKCLRARYAVTQICFEGIQSQDHFDEEIIAYAVMEECIKELERHCKESHRNRLPKPQPVLVPEKGKQPVQSSRPYRVIARRGTPVWSGVHAILAAFGIVIIGAIAIIVVGDDVTLVGVADDGLLVPLGAAAAALSRYLAPALRMAG